ncbi:MAG: methylamine utilization protein MauE [Rhodoferax sp.]|nr:methylamine utilization protein MauE [Rhodoferax sp.]MBK9236088.1 methylamine utilization protein MauE [Rhodoferax sp.]
MAPAFALDPTLAHLCAAVLAIIFLIGAGQKLQDIAMFAAALEQYRLLPQSLTAVAAWALVAAELAAAVLLLPLSTRSLGALLAGGVLAVVTLAVVVNLLRGRSAIDCGCGGPEGSQHLSWALVWRNAGLGLLAVVAAVAATPRALVWLDQVTVLAGALALYGLYAAANQLLANQPRLQKLKGSIQ